MHITPQMLRRIAPNANQDIVTHLAPALTHRFPDEGINTRLRAAHFLAQAAHETAGFRTLTEIGNTAYFRRMYDIEGSRPHVARRLGNTRPGDGALYRGRGIFQLTGRFNYAKFGEKIGVRLETFPERAAEPDISVTTALAYWNDRKLSPFADRDDLRGITRRINGGFNGLADREATLIRAKAALAGQPATAATAQIEARSTGARTQARQARTGAVTAAGAGAVATPVAATQDGSVWLPLVIVGAFVAGAIGLVVWSRSRDRYARTMDANMMEGSGE